MVNWAEVGAVVGILALFEAPLLLIFAWGYRWVQDVNVRLARIEARGHDRRRGDFDHPRESD